jgi:hypothetical protein
MVDHLDPRYRPIVYDVAMSAGQIQHWATVGGPSNGTRARAAQASHRSRHASPQVSGGDNMSPLPEDESQQVSRSDNLSTPGNRAQG